ASIGFYPGVCGIRKRTDALTERLVEQVASIPPQEINHRLLMDDKLGRAKHRKQSLNFRSPVNAAAFSRQVEWCFPDPVSSQEYLASLLVVQADCPETV